MRTILAPLVAAAALVACAGPSANPGAGTHLSASEHDVLAQKNKDEAAEHRLRWDPGAKHVQQYCSQVGASQRDFGECWTSVVNPTNDELAEANRHEKLAAQHRAASKALRDAEARACVGVSDYDRDTSPFSHRADIVRVYPLPNVSVPPPAKPPKIEGAVIVFRPVPKLTADELQRIVDCHIARNDALGHDAPEMLYCPLVPRDVIAKVTQTDEGFEVAIRSTDEDAAREVLHRAQLLSPR
jgi:hypothetical protein